MKSSQIVPEYTVELKGAAVSWASKDKSSKKNVLEVGHAMISVCSRGSTCNDEQCALYVWISVLTLCPSLTLPQNWLQGFSVVKLPLSDSLTVVTVKLIHGVLCAAEDSSGLRVPDAVRHRERNQ